MKDSMGINETELKNLSKLMLRYHDDIKANFLQYSKIIDNTSQYFIGEAANEYRKKYTNFQRNLNVVADSFLDYNQMLNNVIARYNSFDSLSAHTSLNVVNEEVK